MKPATIKGVVKELREKVEALREQSTDQGNREALNDASEWLMLAYHALNDVTEDATADPGTAGEIARKMGWGRNPMSAPRWKEKTLTG